MTREQKEQIDRINELTLNLCNDAYNKGFEAGTGSIQECSWEKGVRDAFGENERGYQPREPKPPIDKNQMTWEEYEEENK